MGDSMVSAIECSVYEDKVQAAHAADRLADRVAEKERDYNTRWSIARRIEDELNATDTEIELVAMEITAALEGGWHVSVKDSDRRDILEAVEQYSKDQDMSAAIDTIGDIVGIDLTGVIDG